MKNVKWFFLYLNGKYLHTSLCYKINIFWLELCLFRGTGKTYNYGLPLTSTLKVQVLLLSYESEAVHVTVICPIVKLDPDAGSHVMLGVSPELSVAIGSSHSTKRVGLPGCVVKLWLKGHESNRGSSLSETIKPR